VEAATVRLRPIVMTSLAFILGVLPLLFSTGAGMEMRRTLGTAVFGGMLGVTVFGIFLTPVFFFMIDWLGDSHLFASRWARRVKSVTLDVFALRGVRRLGGLVLQSVKRVGANGRGPRLPAEREKRIQAEREPVKGAVARPTAGDARGEVGIQADGKNGQPADREPGA